MKGTLRVTVLGCGSSGGVPRATGFWGACDPNEPRNRRTRCGLMLQLWRGAAGKAEEATCVLIDTAPDLHAQLAREKPHHIDAVIYSHDHADQTHGIDDLRAFYIDHKKRIPTYMDAPTRALLTMRFKYCFEGFGGYPAILEIADELAPLRDVAIDGPGGPMVVTPILQDHGQAPSLGFRVGPAAYSNDVVAMPEESFNALCDLDLWIVDALRETPHPTHAHLARTLEWIARLKPAHAVLTNMTHELDYATLKARLPAGIEPAYDGWRADLAL